MDAGRGVVRQVPQMVDRTTVSPDGMKYMFTLGTPSVHAQKDRQTLRFVEVIE
jgi:hypothetical protein